MFVSSFIRSVVRLFVSSFIRSVVRLFVSSFIRSVVRLFVRFVRFVCPFGSFVRLFVLFVSSFVSSVVSSVVRSFVRTYVLPYFLSFVSMNKKVRSSTVNFVCYRDFVIIKLRKVMFLFRETGKYKK